MADTRIDQNSSSSTPSSWDAQQLAILDQERAAEQAATSATNAANKAAASRPAGSGETSPSATIGATYNALGVPTFATPPAGTKPKAARKGK